MSKYDEVHWPDWFSYDSINGGLIRKARIDGSLRGVGKPSGSVTTSGYFSVSFKTRRYFSHRVIYTMLVGPIPKGMSMDHINGDRVDNRIENLRLATAAQNSANGSIRVSNKCGFKGVYFDLDTRKYRAKIRCNNKRFSLGYYSTASQAAAAYNDAALRLHGEFARLNVLEAAE